MVITKAKLHSRTIMVVDKQLKENVEHTLFDYLTIETKTLERVTNTK